jgi:pimeloyl-ACP methyl ester carboxylesterase
VVPALEQRGLQVAVPDLPSHRSSDAGLLADAEAVREAIRSSPAPRVVVGWSYGGTVINVAADREAGIARLIYVASPPRAVTGERDASWTAPAPHITVQDGRIILDEEWWNGAFPPRIEEHLRAHPRRPVSLRAETEPIRAAAWMSHPTTVLLGEHDDLVTPEEVGFAQSNISDVRLLKTDHFILWRTPEVIIAVIDELLQPAGSGGSDPAKGVPA